MTRDLFNMPPWHRLSAYTDLCPVRLQGILWAMTTRQLGAVVFHQEHWVYSFWPDNVGHLGGPLAPSQCRQVVMETLT